MMRWSIVLVTLICLNSLAEAALTPNIVLILADDMGYGDVQALNPTSKIPTPNIDRLAREGKTFVDAHSPSAVCTPTRYGILTGRYCWRTKKKSGVLNGYSAPLIEDQQPTIATIANAKNYHTGIVGKWHLGLGWVRASGAKQIDFSKPLTTTPNQNGFDYSYIIPASLDFPPYVYIRNQNVTTNDIVDQPRQGFPAYLRPGPRGKDLVMEDCLDRLTDEAVDYIKKQSKTENPFLLYFPLTAPHKPVLPHPRFRGETDLGPYADFIVQVDATVGRVLKAIDDAGVKQDTLVIYTSDNGSFMYNKPGLDHVTKADLQQYDPKHHRANFEFRGTKADIWEAGHRVPFFARWPAQIKSGTTFNKPICSVDMLATIADILGVEQPDTAIDSHSLLPAFTGSENQFERPPVIHHSASGMFSIRDGKWKLVLGNGSGGREVPRGKPFQRPYALFDLKNDIAETTNLIDTKSAEAARLEKAFRAIQAK